MGNDDTIELGSGALRSLASCPDRYEIKALIGQGGMGMVFGAFDRELQRDVAIKVLLYEGSREEESQQRFLREARALDALQNHPNIVRIYSSGLNTQGCPFHVMEYLEGNSLSHELNAGPLNAERFYDVFKQVLSGLEYAHNAKIIHRDLKPTNIMHCKDSDGTDLYKIIDFGIARINGNEEIAGKTLTRTNTILGSPAYASPEQCRGERVDYLSDIYSLGCIMYECISGNPPFLGETSFETMYKHMTEESGRLDSSAKSKGSKELASLVEHCLQKDPEARPVSAAEISRQLSHIFGEDLEEIDLFSSQKKLRVDSKLLIASVAIGIVLTTTVFLLLSQAHNSSIKKEFMQKVSGQGKVSSQIEKLKSKLSKWRQLSPQTADSHQQEHYLNDVFALGRQELKSSLPKDIAGAEKLYSDALEYCHGTGEGAKRRMAACFVGRAKAKWKQGRFADSEADFDSAVSVVNSKGKSDSEAYLDIMLEKPLLRIHSAKYEDAFNDYMIVVKSFERDGSKKTNLLDVPQQLSRFNQTLDPLGEDRVAMTVNIAIELRKMKPKSEAEAMQMLRLANRLTLSLSKIDEKQESKLTLKMAESLLAGIPEAAPAYVELKSQDNELRARLGLAQ